MAENLNNVTEGQSVETTDTQETTKTYTQEEVDALLQKESDRRVTEALKKQEKKNADKVREAQKLANMDATQKYEYELQQREQAIAQKEAELALMENKNVASKILADKGIDLALVDFVVAEDAETMNSNIKLLDNAFKKSVKAEVEKRLKSETPTKSLPMDNSMTKDKFLKLSYQEMMDLKREQPEIFEQFAQ